jgi:hypothetical protein
MLCGSAAPRLSWTAPRPGTRPADFRQICRKFASDVSASRSVRVPRRMVASLAPIMASARRPRSVQQAKPSRTASISWRDDTKFQPKHRTWFGPQIEQQWTVLTVNADDHMTGVIAASAITSKSEPP